MNISRINLSTDLPKVEEVANLAFSTTSDSSLDEWFSFSYMKQMITENRGICLKAIVDSDQIAGILYAQQENPINGKEGVEKWVIILAAINPKYTGKGVGSELLKELELQVIQKGCKKIFVFTNSGDEKVINFYHKNGYEDAGMIKDYQYGENNSAVFLLKYL